MCQQMPKHNNKLIKSYPHQRVDEEQPSEKEYVQFTLSNLNEYSKSERDKSTPNANKIIYKFIFTPIIIRQYLKSRAINY